MFLMAARRQPPYSRAVAMAAITHTAAAVAGPACAADDAMAAEGAEPVSPADGWGTEAGVPVGEAPVLAVVAVAMATSLLLLIGGYLSPCVCVLKKGKVKSLHISARWRASQ